MQSSEEPKSKHEAWRAYEKLATGKHRTRKSSPRQYQRTETRAGADLGSDHCCFPKLSRQAHHRGFLSTSPHLSPRAWIRLGAHSCPPPSPPFSPLTPPPRSF